jgi:hypothetical protein
VNEKWKRKADERLLRHSRYCAECVIVGCEKAFRQKAAEFHPDRNTSELAPEKFHAVKEAYDILSDDAARAAYDENRRRNLLDSPLETATDIWKHYLSGVLK